MTATLPTDQTTLATTAAQLTHHGRGILAADESIKTMSSRLAAEGIAPSSTMRRDYREMLITAEGLSEWVSGVIWCDETFGQEVSDGRPFPEAARELGILPGIKVDTGTSPLPGTEALVTEGLDGLGARLESYAAAGAAFAKWRAVFDTATITAYTARVNGHALARYAALCQANGIVPIVEPEVLCVGGHDISTCARASQAALDALFDELDQAGVDLAGVVLKPNFVTPGLDAPAASSSVVAETTFEVLRSAVPAQLSAIAFLSGGHSTADAREYLSEINALGERPWPVTFSFGRALVSDALRAWAGQEQHVAAGQAALVQNCRRAAEATR
ncbi:MAG TPA: class I fructose-bisphosphate aldolase [Marmoricola sp.]|nr:class I fructose-bisphosphate aldolase [Marmoricola sp.]